MFYKNAVNNTANLLADNDIKIDVVPNSLLHAYSISDEGGKDEIATKIATVFGKEVSNYKNNILPDIKRLYKSIEENVKHAIEAGRTKTPDLIKLSIPDSIEDMISDEEITLKNVAWYVDNAPIIPVVENVHDFLAPIADRHTFLRSIPEVELKNIWDRYVKDMNANASKIAELGLPKSGKDLYVVYLILTLLYDNPVEGALGKLEDYNKVIANMTSWLGDKILRRRVNLESKLNAGAIIIASDKDYVVVHESLYMDYMDQGGDIEALFGIVYTDDKPVLLSDVEGRQEELILTWKRVAKSQEMRANQEKEVYYRHAYYVNINSMKGPDSELSPEAIEEIREFYTGLSLMELENILPTLERVYGDILYRNTNLKRFLRVVRSNARTEDTKTAITIAVADLVGELINKCMVRA
jgi:hypothetical protein